MEASQALASCLRMRVHKHWQRKELASNPGFPFRILSCSFGEKSDFSPKLQDKILNGKPGFEARKKLCTCTVE